MKKKTILTLSLCLIALGGIRAQSELYPRHFDLQEVTLLDGPMKTAMELNFQTLLAYDVDRLLTPYVRQSGLAATADTQSRYYRWEQLHPSFPNWGSSDFNLDGHVGGHYLSALSLAWAACRDADTKARLRERLDYMVDVMKDCQAQYDEDNGGLCGFIGGQPINQSWRDLYAGNVATIRGNWGWVPFYCQHKILAGLRDAYIYGDNADAKEVFRKLADWSVSVISRVSDSDMQAFLDCEHGGMNESLLDAYQLFGDQKFLTAARKYSHRTMLDGMQSLATTFLDGKHANTQVPKYIGFERIGEQDATATTYLRAAENFWTDVAQNRTVCIGGNSVSEHFLSRGSSNRYIDILDGPESCNSNNMMKLSEMLSDRFVPTDPTKAARYADFYEAAMWNHILSTQDPTTGGYVYFTTLRPQGYRIYSQVNQAMWCCVGTGMENHSKYGHFIYTHDGNRTLYVNLFTPSRLESSDFVVTQETLFPATDPLASNIPTPQTATSTLTVGKAGTYGIAVRHPAWAGREYGISVNGVAVNAAVTPGTASYVTLDRTWAEGDKIEVWLPMELRYEECPNYGDYIAFKYGPILLAAQTTATSPDDGSGLAYEALQHEYAGAGRMDHAPGSMATSRSLVSAPLLIGARGDVLGRIKPKDLSRLEFTLDASRPEVETYQWGTLTLRPFYQIHHARYQCYWYQQTAENYANSTMAQTEAENEALQGRTLDFVAPGEQQSEAGHECRYSSDSGTGYYSSEPYRDAKADGYVQYSLFNSEGATERLAVLCRFTTADRGRKATLTVDGQTVADITIPASYKGTDANGFFNIEYPIPADLATQTDGSAKEKFVVRLSATGGTPNPGLYYLRLMKDYDDHAYQFRATDWTTGDTNRLQTGNIQYDEEQNTLTVKSSGDNNVCLTLDYAHTDYMLDKAQTYLVVRGMGLRQTSGSSYLWWLNGTNHGTQVAPTRQTTVTVDGVQQQVIAWDMTASGLYENFPADRNSICTGATIFGLTAKSAATPVVIHDINFVSDVEQYLAVATPVEAPRSISSQDVPGYSVAGWRMPGAVQGMPGIYICGGRKQLLSRSLASGNR